jgi:hypothetical protein
MNRSFDMRIAILFIALATATAVCAAPAGVGFAPSADSVDCYDFIEIAVNVDHPDAANPFTDASVQGHFARVGEKPLKVDAFCDCADGRVFRIRFNPRTGQYSPARPDARGDFVAPDREDWALLMK